MITIRPKILEKDGKKEFVVLTYEEFIKIQEELEDYEDLKELRKAKQEEANAPAVDLKKAKKELGLE
ncbi:MAG TPA: type II toxin-antitoxin system Phd/YefM family antitoxin [Nitrospirae bacterium]|nr:type II toxin-antitoxin system Phd/YefM family antitoxin [Nitrospirota bacterium]